MLAAAGLLALSAWHAFEASTLARGGVQVEALITDRRIDDRRSTNGTHQRSYRVTARYTLPSGPTTTREFGVSERFYEQARPGTSYPVTLLPDAPEIAQLDPGRNAAVGGMSLWVGLALLLAGGGLCGLGQRAHQPLRRAARHGERREAEVRAIQPVNAASPSPAILAFRDSAGVIGTSRPYPAVDLPALGETVTVYADPATGRTFWERDLQG